MKWIFNPLKWIYQKVTGAGVVVDAINPAEALLLRNEFLDRFVETDNITALLASGDITVNQWEMLMRENIRDVYKAQYLLGVGGEGNMTQADYGRLGGLLQTQYNTYLSNFSEDLRQGKLTVGQAQTRAKMYINSSTRAYEMAKTLGMGMPELPAYPGDGSTVCKANCRCSWEIDETETEWECYWTLGFAEHCPDCEENAGKWNPLVLPK